jgi:hypothetical protein
VATGATVPVPLPDELVIYSGTPARKLKDLPEDAVLSTASAADCSTDVDRVCRPQAQPHRAFIPDPRRES